MTRLRPGGGTATPGHVDPPRYGHLQRLTDRTGVFEHARYDVPRRAHGYCVDDVARALLVTVRAPEQTDIVRGMTATYLGFLGSAVGPSGLAHNRMDVDGLWTDEASVGDWWGRTVWATGIASVHAVDPSTRRAAAAVFDRAAQRDAIALHTVAFAVLGAGPVLLAAPSHLAARRILERFAAMLPVDPGSAWPWPEDRLRYANGSVAEAVIVTGRALNDRAIVDRGLSMLRFLLQTETRSGHLSVTGTEGRGPAEVEAQFDQQPIEVAAIGDACVAAFAATGDPAFIDGVRLAWAWFEGDNDSGIPMIDLETGAGFDGLETTGRNLNRGAESTLAALATWQLARRFLSLSAA
ncbi:glycosyltransferase [Amnibacterium sp.]|uniref:glycosyltransferase n=1 Tax=Amnibacterium sp. TaxID=1872496 RepID=UPI00262B688C|nr:glycosyltransferase [Amnibacterium sp.]MCU1472422.1 hypothetical protein [Amnibacterium sp.]